jgi:crotonobetainyl-CoA:carnitine CoA-transferase CaiB-like acyl-CoA transferase
MLKENSAYFLALNRNKKSMTLDLRKEKGREIFLKLVKTSDAVIDGFRPGVMRKMGLGYDALQAANERIIVCAISGYGQDGPYADRAGHDLNYISIAGLTSLTGLRDGRPVQPGLQLADIGAGSLTAAYSILAAVIARQKTGKGQFVDVSMMDGAMAFLCLYGAKYFADGITPAPARELLNGQFACYNIYKTSDGRYLSLGALEGIFWTAFCQAVGKEDWIPLQYAQGQEGYDLIDEVQKFFSERSQADWLEALKNVDCCLEPVNTLEEAFKHPQVRHRQIVAEMNHPVEGKIRQLNTAAKFSLTPAEIRTPPPGLGEHTDQILRELGCQADEIASLREEKVI